MKELCRTEPEGEPSLFVFYDDAQNLYGRQRPNWNSLGLNIKGRSHIMSECFRNNRQIMEAAFNVLYGSFASEKTKVPTKAFGDIGALEEKELLHHVDGVWRVRFAKRDGLNPRVTITQDRQRQWDAMTERLRWLIEKQQVRMRPCYPADPYRTAIEKKVSKT